MPPPFEDKETKRARLRRLRWVATGLLGAMVVCYVIARSFEHRAGWIGFVRAFAEAAMVGAMADWFAVVALFRHPLGIPIPHTAIVRRRQSEVGQGLGNFIVENFLTREIISRRLEKLDLTGAATGWLLGHADSVADKVLGFVPRLLDALDDRDVARVVYSRLIEKAREIPVAPLLGRTLEILTSGEKHEAVLSQALHFADSLVTENREVIAGGIEKELPMPEKIGPVSLVGVRRKLAHYVSGKVVTNVQRVLREVGENPEHELRARFGERLRRFVADLRESPEYLARGEAIKEEMLANAALHDYAAGVWGQLKAAVNADLAKPDSALRRHLVGLVRSVAGAIHEDQPLRGRLNDSLRAGALDFVEKNAADIGRLIEETVRSWNPDDLIEKLELEVGRDLQFIRLNGTVVGGLVGVLIHTLSLLVWR